jgi:cyclopropane fatty-acyl-phospholipid synthase-like methyltransferase
LAQLSPRLSKILEALPLAPGMRVLEIGCGPGALARAIAERVELGFVLGIDRSATAVTQARSVSQSQLKAGRLAFRQAAIEDFVPAESEEGFDLIVAVRVGALDGRHPEAGFAAMRRIAAALKPGGRLFVDGIERSVNQSLPR